MPRRRSIQSGEGGLSVSCPDCGAVAGYGQEIGHRSNCVRLDHKPRRTLTDGSPVTSDHREINPATGQQKGYVVLSAEERAKGYVKPVRRTYVHLTCGHETTMGLALAETYARDPDFYGGTFCCACRQHFTFGQPGGDFVWLGTDEKVGT